MFGRVEKGMNKETEHQTVPQNPGKKRQAGGVLTREDRLKSALKANMARRKAQAKARTGQNKENGQGQ